jgi:hypothetical protein
MNANAAALDPGTCRSCGAPIFFVAMTSGKRMPLNQTPKKAVIIDKATGQGSIQDAYTSHFATCPKADQHRRKP